MRPSRRCSAVLAAATIVLCASTAAMGVPTIYVSAAHTEVDMMDYCTVEVMINDEVLGVTGYNLLIDFDEGIILVDSVFEGNLPWDYQGDTFFYWSDDGNPSNALRIQGAVLGGSVNGQGSLASVRFYGLDLGTSPLGFLSVDLRDIDNHSIPVTWVGGDVVVSMPSTGVDGDLVVTPAIPAASVSWGRIKALYIE
jgi:hypothetical protein